ncbi:TPA: Ig-like domain-containing protein [Vibrio vulnificus]|nr:chitinase [Vibrio vulnificus]
MRVTLLSSALISALGVSYQAQAYNCQSLATWNSSEIYTSGSQVQKENQAFEAAYWTQGNDPVTNSGPWEAWKSLGQCDNGGGNLPPSITFSSPTNNAEIPEGASITLLANASDEDGQVSQVEFLAGTQLIAVVTQAPFETPWTAVKGTSQLTAIATDNKGAIQSTNVNISVLPQGELAPPTISLTSPTGSETLSDKDRLVVSAQATDSDGIVTQVEFFVDNQSVFVDTNAPYEYLWNAVAGTHTFKAQATDDANLTTMSQNVSLVVSGSHSGGCADAVPYLAGTRYEAGTLVSNLNQKYRCDVAGWCSSDAAWAYEPGVGQYWQDAWSGLGACSTPPQITITSPNDGAVVLAGSNLTLSADASDADGSVTQVEFFANNSSLGVVTQPPYVQTWSATFVGANQLKAIATDNDNNVSESVVNVTVSDQALVVTLTSPTAGQTVGLGKNVTLSADATSLTSAIKQVDFVVNGSVIATDNSAPYSVSWTPAAIGNFTVSAQAVDLAGNQALSEAAAIKVVEQSEKRHKLIGYWHNFVNGAGCPIRLADMSNTWDVIDIAFAENDRNSNGTVHFNLYSGDIYSSCAPLDPVQFKQDMAALQAQGKKFVLSLGGAEGTITLNTDQDEANFVSSLTALIKEWGFDGLDVDLESGSNLVHGSQIQARLGRALLQIEQNIGGDMYLTMAPEHPYVQGGMVAYSGIWGAYIPVINATRSTLDLLHVQLYNNGGLPNPYLPGAAPEGSVDMMVAQSKMLIEGFELADGTRFEPLRDDQVAIGLPSGPSSANSGQAPTQNILDALDCLTLGTKCTTVRPAFNYPNFGGVMTWSINWDEHDGFNFSKPVGDKLTQMNAR